MRRVLTFGSVLLAGSLVLTACSSDGDSSSDESPQSDVKVGLAYDIGGRGDQSFNDSAARGLDRAAEEFGVEVRELSAAANETDAQKEERLRLLAEGGFNPVIAVGFAYATALGNVAAEFPDTSFAIIDDASVEEPNVASLTFAEEQGSFLVGVIAAQASESGNIGFVGGVEVPLIKKFEAGYTAGAQSVNPDIQVQVKYLTQPPDFTGFNDPAKGQTAAQGMYDAGADVVYQAAGGSGSGVFAAAEAAGALSIGVDSDQYLTATEGKETIITSMLKQVDVAVYEMIKSAVDGSPLSGQREFDLEAGGVGYSDSNSAVEPYVAAADEAAEAIKSGEITVPKE